MTGGALTPEDDFQAAEFVLGLLADTDLMEARRRRVEDPAFASAVLAWEDRLMPLALEVAAVTPESDIWARIKTRIEAEAEAGSEVIILRRRVRFWQSASAVAAVAASLVLALGVERGSQEPRSSVVQPQPDRSPMLMAALASDEDETLASVLFDPAQSTILLTPGRLDRLRGRDHELWVIPEGGSPVSIGLLQADRGVQRLPVAASVATHLRARSTLALSVEPSGGSPNGKPTGPVVATGEVLIV